jgi:UDP-glucose:glycoprotein glucosyltransferase
MDYYSKIGLKKLPQVLMNGFPLTENEMEAEILEESIITKIMKLTPDMQMAVYKGDLRDSMNLVDWLMKRDEIMPRLNARILSTDREYLDFNKLRNNEVVRDLRYLFNENVQTHFLTLWIVCDPDTERGRKFLYDSIEFYESSKLSPRLAILFQKSSQDENDLMKKSIQFALENMSKKQATSFIKKILKEKNFNELKSNKKSLGQLEFPDLSVNNLEENVNQFDLSKVLNQHQEFLKSHLPFKRPTDIGLIANGWIVGPLNDDEAFFDSDFTLLENFMLKIGLKQIKDQFQKWKNLNNVDDLILMVNSMLGKYASSEKRVKLPELSAGKVNIKPLKENVPFYDIVVVIDPLSRQAQKISTILKVLTQTTNVNLVIYFNCKERLSAPPLKSFYRYVIESEVKFNNGKSVKPFAYFHNMPQSPILTMNIHSPESWMVEASNSPYDLDNICLKEIDSDGAYGEFELEHLIIEGHAHDVISGQPPRGLQFNLGTSTNPVMYDTIVMANLGYFQLKASPGMWILQLRDGRSKDIYEVISHENTDSESKRSTKIVIVIDSFESRVIKVKVSKKADKVNENLLDDKDNEKDGGIWNSIATSFTSSDEANKQDVLNIFSVASGHLYERLMR